MPIFEYNGRTIQINDEGYLENFDEWDETVACALAEREGVSKTCPMNQEQLEILRFIREYYKKFNSVPIVRAVCTNVHQPQKCEYICRESLFISLFWSPSILDHDAKNHYITSGKLEI